MWVCNQSGEKTLQESLCFQPIRFDLYQVMRDELGIEETFEELVLEALAKAGYTKATDPCFVQTFEVTTILELKRLTSV